MDKFEAIYSSNTKAIAIASGVLVASAGILTLRWLRRRKSVAGKDYPRDTVIFHQIGRGPYAPSMTPFTVKLETYLRMAKIPYQNVHDSKLSSKGKFPWITYNGEEVADSAFCIIYLNKHLNIDLNSRLSVEQRAVAVAIQRMVEEDLYWALAVTRYVNELDMDFLLTAFKVPFARLLLHMFLLRNVRKAVWAQGIGRHSKDEVIQIARKDLTALSDFLGNKKFLMGEEPCEEDCAVFGQLAQLYVHLPSTLSTIFKEEYPRLVAYCERMKETFWPDWVECTTQGGTVKATK